MSDGKGDSSAAELLGASPLDAPTIAILLAGAFFNPSYKCPWGHV